jgi:hypothetical protein
MVESAYASLASTGVVGVILVLTILALRVKDDALSTEKNARIEDAQKFLALALSLQKEVTLAVSALTEIVKKWEKREEEQERLEREVARARVDTPQEFVPQGRPR